MFFKHYRKCIKCCPILYQLSMGFIIGVILAVVYKSPSFVYPTGLHSSIPSLAPKRHVDNKESDPERENSLAGADILVKQHSPDEEYHVHSDWEAKQLNQLVSVFCIVHCTMNTKIKNQIKAIEAIVSTWGARCNNLLFVSDHNETIKVDNAQILQFPELQHGEGSRWGRTKAILNHTYEKHRNEADWFLRVEDTNYVIMENLRILLQPRKGSEPIYFGYKMKQYVDQGYMSGGAGLVLSKKALELVVTEGFRSKNKTKCRQDSGGAEDVELGRCLSNVGVRTQDSRDEHHRHRFLPFKPEQHLIPKLIPKTLWNSTFYPHTLGMDCCSDSAIAFHMITNRHMFRMEFLLYHLRPYGISQNIHNRNITLPPSMFEEPKSHTTRKPTGHPEHLLKKLLPEKPVLNPPKASTPKHKV